MLREHNNERREALAKLQKIAENAKLDIAAAASPDTTPASNITVKEVNKDNTQAFQTPMTKSTPGSFRSAASRQTQTPSSDDEFEYPRKFRVERSGHTTRWSMSPASKGSPLSSIPETPENIYANTGDRSMPQASGQAVNLATSGIKPSSGGAAFSDYKRVMSSDYKRIVSKLEADGKADSAKLDESIEDKRGVTFSSDDSIIPYSGATSFADSSYVSAASPDIDQALAIFKKRGFDVELIRLDNGIPTLGANHNGFSITATPTFPVYPRGRIDVGNIIRGPPGYTPAPHPAPRSLHPFEGRKEETGQEAQKKLERPTTLAITSKATNASVRPRITEL